MEQQEIYEIRQRNIPVRMGYAIMQAAAWPGRMLGWLNVVIIIAVLSAVVGSLLRMNILFEWGFYIPVFGTELSLTGVSELQWHLFGLNVMLGGAYTLLSDRHIRVDFIYGRLTPRWQSVVDIVGDLLFLIPFCVLMVWLSQSFIHIAYISGEKSDYGGLMDRYLIKTIIPIGFAVLAVSGLGRVILNLGRVWETLPQNTRGDEA